MNLHPLRLSIAAATVVLALAAIGPAQAERADRGKPLNVEADQPGRIDLANQFVVFNGNVVVTKGTMVIRAARIEVRESSDGFHTALAIGTADRPASFRQKRDGVDEHIDGQADRLEYDGRADTVRFVGNAVVRRLRGASTADELSGSLVTYDNAAEVFSVAGGASSPANPGGRVRVVLTPRAGSPGADAASAPPQTAPVLKSSPALGAKP